MRRIKVLREARGFSQFGLSQQCGMSQGRYSMLERGLIQATPEERVQLARVLQAPAETLFRPAIKLRPLVVTEPALISR